MSGVSIVSQIVAFASAALIAGSPPAGLTVNRFRTYPYRKSNLPAMSVYPLDDEQIERVGTDTAPLSERHFHFRVACYDRGDPIDLALDPLYVWAIQTLMADQTFGGLLESLQHMKSHWRVDDEDEVYGAVGLDFAARLMVVAANPTATY
jgi:hypothetical protein